MSSQQEKRADAHKHKTQSTNTKHRTQGTNTEHKCSGKILTRKIEADTEPNHKTPKTDYKSIQLCLYNTDNGYRYRQQIQNHTEHKRQKHTYNRDKGERGR